MRAQQQQQQQKGSPQAPAAAAAPNDALLPSLLRDLRASTLPFSDASTGVVSWRFLGAMVGVTALSLSAFSLLQADIVANARECLFGVWARAPASRSLHPPPPPPPRAEAAGYAGDPADLLILDLRNGYTADEVSRVLGAWGPHGRLNYLAIEAIDVLFYHFGYRGVGLVLANRGVRACMARWPALLAAAPALAALPIVLAWLDFGEDVLQVAAVGAYEAGAAAAAPQAWAALIATASAANVTKWAFCRLASATLGGVILAGLGSAAWERVQQWGGGNRG